MIRKFQITEETVEEEISQPSGLSGIVLAIGNFEKADANVPYLITNSRNIPDTIGNDPSYSGSKILTQLFKKDEEEENYGASAVIALQVGERARASMSVDIDGATLKGETLTGGNWGNGLKYTLAEGTDTGFLFVLTDSKGKNLFNINNKSIENIIKQVNGSNKHIKLSLEDKSTATFTEVTNQSFTGGNETSSSFTVENLYTVLNYLNKDKFNILIFTEKLQDTLFNVVKEYIEERYSKGKQSIAILPLTSTDDKETKISKVESARSKLGRVYYINQTINDLNEAETCARIAGAIAGLQVKDSLSEYILHDIDSVHPILSETDIEDLTAAGIICLELENSFSGNYKVYSSVSSCIDVGENGELVPQSELHAVRSADYCFDELNDVEEKYLAKTGVKKRKDSLKSALDQKASNLVKEPNGIVENIELSLDRDPKNPKKLIKDRTVKVFGILEKIHNRDKIVWE